MTVLSPTLKKIQDSKTTHINSKIFKKAKFLENVKFSRTVESKKVVEYRGIHLKNVEMWQVRIMYDGKFNCDHHINVFFISNKILMHVHYNVEVTSVSVKLRTIYLRFAARISSNNGYTKTQYIRHYWVLKDYNVVKKYSMF